jgi:hypothetical protein
MFIWETTLDMRIYLLDAKKFFKKKRFGVYGRFQKCVKWKYIII